MKKLIFKTHRNAKIQSILIDRFLQRYKGVEIEFEAEPEDMNPEESFDDPKAIKWIRSDDVLDYYGVSARWFCAKVTVKYRGYEATDYLGGCSYNSYEEFKNDGYYDNMISTCIDEINNSIQEHNDRICKTFKIRNIKKLAEELDFILIPKTAII